MLRRRVLLTAIWAAVTLAAVGIAWLAVSHAVATVADPVPAVISGGRRAAVPRTTTTLSTTVTTAIGAAPSTSSTAVVAPSSAHAPAATQSTDLATASDGPVVGDTLPVQRRDATAGSGAPSENTASFNSSGGVVTMSCRGTLASLVSATPDPGYTVTVSGSGPESIEVAFGSPSAESEFHGVCVDGFPAPEVSGD